MAKTTSVEISRVVLRSIYADIAQLEELTSATEMPAELASAESASAAEDSDGRSPVSHQSSFGRARARLTEAMSAFERGTGAAIESSMSFVGDKWDAADQSATRYFEQLETYVGAKSKKMSAAARQRKNQIAEQVARTAEEKSLHFEAKSKAVAECLAQSTKQRKEKVDEGLRNLSRKAEERMHSAANKVQGGFELLKSKTMDFTSAGRDHVPMESVRRTANAVASKIPTLRKNRRASDGGA